MRWERRETKLIGVAPDRQCGLCGNDFMMLSHSRAARRGLSRINPWFDPQDRTYEVCPGCGARQQVEGQQAS